MTYVSETQLPDPYRHSEFYEFVPTKRLFAWLIDTVLVALLTAIIVPFTAFTALFFLPVLFMSLGFIYRWVSLARSSATPGMRLMSIHFLDRWGQPFDAGTAFAHTLGYTLSMSFVLPQIASVAFMLLSGRGQGLTDMVLGTVAINRAAQM